jgi:hypothetical protein
MAFMNWWKLTNRILVDRGLPEMLYGEARGYYSELGL